MSFVKKEWHNKGESVKTPISADGLNDLENRINNGFNSSETSVLKKAVKCQTWGWINEITVDMSDTYLGIMQVDTNLLVLLWKGNEYVLHQTVYTDNSVTYTTPGGEENIKYEKKFKFNKNVNVGIYKL